MKEIWTRKSETWQPEFRIEDYLNAMLWRHRMRILCLAQGASSIYLRSCNHSAIGPGSPLSTISPPSRSTHQQIITSNISYQQLFLYSERSNPCFCKLATTEAQADAAVLEPGLLRERRSTGQFVHIGCILIRCTHSSPKLRSDPPSFLVELTPSLDGQMCSTTNDQSHAYLDPNCCLIGLGDAC